MLEDLHWADQGTLDVLLHLARGISTSRILILGTYRNVEVDRRHPLSGVLAELQRLGGFKRLLLHGLTPDEVQQMMSAGGGPDVTEETAANVHRETEGNPLFVQEVQRYLVDEGLLIRDGDRWRALSQSEPIAMGLPEGLLDVIGKRLTRLSAECNRVLAVASVIGRDFELKTLRGTIQLGDEELISALEEAERSAIIEVLSRPGIVRFRFAHALFRQALYEELSTPHHLQIHQNVARVLESQYTQRLEEHAAELADHFSRSTDPGDLMKAVGLRDACRATGDERVR